MMPYMHIFPSTILCETSTVDDGNMSFRSGTYDEVLAHRVQFLEKNSVSSSNYLPMHCEHGETITVVDDTYSVLETAEPEKWIPSEVLVTQTKNLALFLLTADCQPMSFYDPVTDTIALAHISRVTLTKKLPQKTVHFLRQILGVKPENLLVYIGPHIKKASYTFNTPLKEVDLKLITFTEEENGIVHINLEEASIAQLHSAGIRIKHISISPIDTGTSIHHFSHHTLKKHGQAHTARMATILMMR